MAHKYERDRQLLAERQEIRRERQDLLGRLDVTSLERGLDLRRQELAINTELAELLGAAAESKPPKEGGRVQQYTYDHDLGELVPVKGGDRWLTSWTEI